MALHGVSVRMVSSYNGCVQPQQQQSVWSRRPPHAPMHTCRPSALLMFRAVLTLAVKVWLCGMTRIEANLQGFVVKIQPKIVSLYASIYANLICVVVIAHGNA